MRAVLCLLLMGSLAAQNLHDSLSQPPKQKLLSNYTMKI